MVSFGGGENEASKAAHMPKCDLRRPPSDTSGQRQSHWAVGNALLSQDIQPHEQNRTVRRRADLELKLLR